MKHVDSVYTFSIVSSLSRFSLFYVLFHVETRVFLSSFVPFLFPPSLICFLTTAVLVLWVERER